MAGTGWRSSLVRLALCAGFLCAAWVLLGAGEARADGGPIVTATPSVGDLADRASDGVGRRALSLVGSVKPHALTAIPGRPSPHRRAIQRKAQERRAAVARMPLRSQVPHRPLASVVRSVQTVVAPTGFPVAGVVGQLRHQPVAALLSDLPVISRVPVLKDVALRPLLGGLAVDPTDEPDAAAADIVPLAQLDRLLQPSAPTIGAGRFGAVTTLVEAALASRQRPGRAAPNAPAPRGGDAPVLPWGQGLVPPPEASGSGSVATDMALPCPAHLLPGTANPPCSAAAFTATSASSKGPGHRPD
jgi:hypothetical protein